MDKQSNVVLLELRSTHEQEQGDEGRINHDWLVGSPENKVIATALRLKSSENDYKQTVTTFNYDPEDDPELTCDDILDVIDMHHGEFASIGPYSELEVRGANLSSHLRSRLKRLGFGKSYVTRCGFRVVR